MYGVGLTEAPRARERCPLFCVQRFRGGSLIRARESRPCDTPHIEVPRKPHARVSRRNLDHPGAEEHLLPLPHRPPETRPPGHCRGPRPCRLSQRARCWGTSAVAVGGTVRTYTGALSMSRTLAYRLTRLEQHTQTHSLVGRGACCGRAAPHTRPCRCRGGAAWA